jgi:membrane protein YqaA with SNARE-associated domain
MTCFYIGWLGKIEWIEKYLKVKKDKLDRFSVTIQRYGNWIAFFTFLPGIGDFIAIASGFFKCKPWLVGTSMLLGKFIRYIVWMYLNGLFF